MLYDHNGREVAPTSVPPQAPPPVVPRYGRWSTSRTKGLTPAKLASLLKAGEQGDWFAWAELAEDIEERDDHISSVLQTRRLAVMGRRIEVTAASTDAADQDVADFVAGVLEQCDILAEVGTDLLDALSKGLALVRVDWSLNGHRKVVPSQFEWVHQKFLTEDIATGALRLRTEDHPRGMELEPWRWLMHRHRARSGWQNRAGLMRTLVWLYLFKHYSLKDWVVFAEVYGQPLRLGKYKAHSSEDDREALRQALVSLGTDAAGIIPDGTAIEFVQANVTSSHEVYERLAAYCDRAISKVVLGQTLTTDTSGGTGTFAAADVHDRVREDLIDADCKALVKTLRTQLVQPLVGWNFGWERPLPLVALVSDESEDQLAVARLFRLAQEAGVQVPRSYAYARLGIPEPEEDEKVLEPPTLAAAEDGT